MTTTSLRRRGTRIAAALGTGALLAGAALVGAPTGTVRAGSSVPRALAKDSAVARDYEAAETARELHPQ